MLLAKRYAVWPAKTKAKIIRVLRLHINTEYISSTEHSDPRIGHAMRLRSSAARQRTCYSWRNVPRDPGDDFNYLVQVDYSEFNNSTPMFKLWALARARSERIGVLKEIIRQTIRDEGLH